MPESTPAVSPSIPVIPPPPANLSASATVDAAGIHLSGSFDKVAGATEYRVTVFKDADTTRDQIDEFTVAQTNTPVFNRTHPGLDASHGPLEFEVVTITS